MGCNIDLKYLDANNLNYKMDRTDVLNDETKVHTKYVLERVIGDTLISRFLLFF